MLLGRQPCERVSTMAALFVCYGFNLLIWKKRMGSVPLALFGAVVFMF